MQVEYRGMHLIVPANDTEWKGYFEAAREHRLVLKQCRDCGQLRYPPGAACPWCTSRQWTWQEVSGKGTIHSYEIVVQAIQAGFRDWAPYPVVLVELDEQRAIGAEVDTGCGQYAQGLQSLGVPGTHNTTVRRHGSHAAAACEHSGG